jgi:hypothetical protein
MRPASLLITLWNCATIAAAYGGSHGVPSHRFVPVADGVALDARAHLEWTSRDHVQPLPWGEADRFCRESSRGGRTGWRLPEIGELQALYDKRFNEPCGDRRCHLDPAIRLGGPYVWSASTRGADTRFYLDFSTGTSLSPSVAPRLVRQVLCVHEVSATPGPTSDDAGRYLDFPPPARPLHVPS